MNRLQQKLRDEITEAAERGMIRLTDWEEGFIDTLNTRSDDYELSFNENKKLNEISQKQFVGW